MAGRGADTPEAELESLDLSESLKFQPDRPASAIAFFSIGPHECIGRETAISFITGLVKLVAGLKCLRPALGDHGMLKSIRVGIEKAYLNDSWSHLTSGPTNKFTKQTYLPLFSGIMRGKTFWTYANVLGLCSLEVAFRWLRQGCISAAQADPLPQDRISMVWRTKSRR